MNRLATIIRRKIKQLTSRHGTSELEDLIIATGLFLCDTPELTPIIARLYNEGKISRKFVIQMAIYFSVQKVSITVVNKQSPEQKIVPEFIYKTHDGLSIINAVFDSQKEANEYHESVRGQPVEQTIQFATSAEVRADLTKILKLCNDILDEIELGGARNEVEKKNGTSLGNPFLFYISHSKGLYREFRENEKPYPIHRAKDRFRILKALTENYTPTSEVAEMLRKKPQAVRGQIAGIRKVIEGHFAGIRGRDFIESEQTRGYRIGEKITLKTKE